MYYIRDYDYDYDDLDDESGDIAGLTGKDDDDLDDECAGIDGITCIIIFLENDDHLDDLDDEYSWLLSCCQVQV